MRATQPCGSSSSASVGIWAGSTHTRFSAAMGTLMMLFFFIAAWDFEFGIVNQHLTYALVTAFLGLIGAGNYYGLDRRVGESAPPWVRRWLLSGTPGAAAGTDPSLHPITA